MVWKQMWEWEEWKCQTSSQIKSFIIATISISKDLIGKRVVWVLNTTCHAIIHNGFCSLISKGPSTVLPARKTDLALQLLMKKISSFSSKLRPSMQWIQCSGKQILSQFAPTVLWEPGLKFGKNRTGFGAPRLECQCIWPRLMFNTAVPRKIQLLPQNGWKKARGKTSKSVGCAASPRIQNQSEGQGNLGRLLFCACACILDGKEVPGFVIGEKGKRKFFMVCSDFI